jgi:DinB family protein
MKSMWDADASRGVRDRVNTLTPDRKPQWGRMSAPQMVCHLAESLKMALGELPVKSKKVPIRYPPLKQLIVYLAPFPKNVPTAPELLARSPRDWNADVADLQGLVDRFSARGARASWPEHPAFGKLSGRAWGVLAYRHMDHHLRQFGA